MTATILPTLICSGCCPFWTINELEGFITPAYPCLINYICMYNFFSFQQGCYWRGQQFKNMCLMLLYVCSVFMFRLTVDLTWVYFTPCSGELQMQKLKSHVLRTQSLKVLPFKPGIGQYKAIHASLTARDFSLGNFYPSSLLTFNFSRTSSQFFWRWLSLTLVPVWAHRRK